MKAMFIALVLVGAAIGINAGEFKPLFNEKNLQGWDGDSSLWKVENGLIVGICDGPTAMKHNSFLIWRGGELKDFELKVTMRVIGDNNSGIQYRSRELLDVGRWVISGYQCDVHPAQEHTGMTYEEKGRGIFGLNGNNVALDENAQRWRLSKHEPVNVDVSEWNEYTVIVKGNHLIHKVNDQVTSELIDGHVKGRSMEGLLAFQLHRGNRNRVEIKEVKLKELIRGKLVEFNSANPPEGAERIDRPRTTNPQGTGPVLKTRLILEDDFSDIPPDRKFRDFKDRWRQRISFGEWTSPQKGTVKAVNVPAHGHGPVITYQAPLEDVIIECEFKLPVKEGPDRHFRIFLDHPDYKGHTIAAWANLSTTFQPKGLTLLHNPKTNDKKAKAQEVRFGPEEVNLQPGKWHKMRLELIDDSARVSVDGVVVKGTHLPLKTTKNKVALNPGKAGGELRGFKVWKVEK